ncbi:hypothetical protein ACS60D_08255 [Streptococcus suis]
MTAITDILDEIKAYIERQEFDKKYFKSNGNSNGFEKLFDEDVIRHLKSKYQNENIKFNLITGQHFPDMDIVIDGNKYGVELKSSQKGEWSIPGNSTLESQTDDDYIMIYLIFGSRTSNEYKYEILYDEYWKVASQIKVTHSPRFIIDMKGQQTVFKNNNEYENFRRQDKSNKSRFLSDYLKDNTSHSTWYAPSKDTFVYEFKSLDEKNKDELRIFAYLLFPFDVLNNSKKNHRNNYSNYANFLINNYSVYSTNLRDVFTAAGKGKINGIEVSKSLYNFYLLRNEIDLVLVSANVELAKKIKKAVGYTGKKDIKTGYWTKINKFLKREFDDEFTRGNSRYLGKDKFSDLI